MSSVRDLGEELALVLCLYDGKDFVPPPPSSSQAKLIVVASLDSKETLESNPVDFANEEPEIIQELVWTMSRLTFQSLRSRKSPIKAQFFAKDNDEDDNPTLLGTLLLDLREAVPKTEADPDESYLIHANWKKLINPSVPPGRSPPSVKAALLIEPSVVTVQETPTKKQKAPEILPETTNTKVTAETEKDKEEQQDFPVLNEKGGYFHIGPEADATHTYMFNIFICFGRNLQLAFPKDVKVSWDKDQLTFNYDLFGVEIKSCPFTVESVSKFKPERATAKLFTTPEKCLNYFKNIMEPFEISVSMGNSKLSSAVINLASLLPLDLANLAEEEKLAVFEGLVPVHPVQGAPKDGNANDPGEVRRNLSENLLGEAHIAVRFSLGLKPDPGLASEEPIKLKSSTESEEIEIEDSPPSKFMAEGRPSELGKEIVAPIPSRPTLESARKSLDFSQPPSSAASISPLKTTAPPADVSVVDIADDGNPLESMETDDADQSRNEDIVMQQVRGRSDEAEAVKKFKFIMDLKTVELAEPGLGRQINCIINYKYKPFTNTEVSTRPAFTIDAYDSSPHEVRRGYCEYNFSAKESALRRPFNKHKLFLKVFDNEEQIGAAALDLSQLFTIDALLSDDTRTCTNQKLPILKKNAKGSADLLGYITITYTLKEIPSATSNPLSKAPVGANPAFPVTSGTKDDLYKSALEVEEWKKKQKERFKEQLQALEAHHINTLTKEWERREKERENVVHDKMAEIISAEKDLKTALQELKGKHDALAKYEEDLNRREVKLKEREERLKSFTASKSSNTAQADAKTVQKLRLECDSWKAKFEAAKILGDQASSLQKQVNTLRSQLSEKASLEERYQNAMKARDAYKKSLHDAELEIRALRDERDRHMTDQMDLYRKENLKLKSDLDKARNQYERKVTELASTMSSTSVLDKRNNNPASAADVSDESSDKTETTVVSNKNFQANKEYGRHRNEKHTSKESMEREVLRLRKERELFLNTKVYSESDEIIKIIDAKLKDLQDGL